MTVNIATRQYGLRFEKPLNPAEPERSAWRVAYMPFDSYDEAEEARSTCRALPSLYRNVQVVERVVSAWEVAPLPMDFLAVRPYGNGYRTHIIHDNFDYRIGMTTDDSVIFGTALCGVEGRRGWLINGGPRRPDDPVRSMGQRAYPCSRCVELHHEAVAG